MKEGDEALSNLVLKSLEDSREEEVNDTASLRRKALKRHAYQSDKKKLPGRGSHLKEVSYAYNALYQFIEH